MDNLPFSMCRTRAVVAMAVLALAAGCGMGYTPGVPLYPNGRTARLPPGQVAQVFGPIAKVDGQSVEGQGGAFDLLPGCHIVELERRVTADSYGVANGVYWTGEFPRTIYALRMKAGTRTVIRRDIFADGTSGRMVLTAREEDATGRGTDLDPAKSMQDLTDCKQWESTALRP